MKKRKKKRIWGILICMVMLLCMFPLQTEAKTVTKNLYVGNSLNLTYSNKSVNWSTSNTSIAKISTNKGQKVTVTAVKAGTATISAKENGKTVAICVVNVKNHSLNLNKSNITLPIGNKTPLKVNSSATANKIRWVSSNENIVSISATTGTKEILLTGKKAGSATITVKCGNVKKTCKVTVKGSSTSTSNNSSVDANSIIKKYYSQNPQHIKISDGNGAFDKLNGHASTQKAGHLMTSKMDNNNAYMATGGNKYNYIWHLGGESFQSVSWDFPISLSFNDTTFQTGETCGVLRVLNCSVPGSSYTWSSSNSNVIGIQVMTPDTSAVKILAKSQGSADITCKINFPNGESKTLSSKVNVSDSIGNNIKNGTVNMNSVMERVADTYRNRGVKWIPDIMSTFDASKIGYTALGSYGAYDIGYNIIEKKTSENIFNPGSVKYLNDPESYIVHYASEIESEVYYLCEYQGHNLDEGCIQMASVGVLSIPTVK